ncbi:MAG: tetratricopeptide repeat protein [Bdellovibrionota bacterium]
MTDAMWNLKDKKGRIFGPFTTNKIMNLIERGFLDGQELITPKNAERWVEISKYPEFYDVIMEALKTEHRTIAEKDISAELTMSQYIDKVSTSDQEEQPQPEAPLKRGKVIIEGQREAPTRDKKVSSGQNKAEKIEKTEHTTSTGPQFKPPIIDLRESVSFLKKQYKINKIVNIVIGIVAIILIFIIFSSFENRVPLDEGKIHLLFPMQKKSPLSLSETQELLKQSLSEFQEDDFKGYYKTLQILVGLLESNPKNLDAISLLCLTYRELWPFAFQDSKDLQNLTKLVQIAQAENSLGVHGATCRAVQASITAENSAMNAVLQSLLSDYPTAAILYEMKAQVLSSEKQSSTAIAFVQKTQSLWPQWIKPFFLEAQMRADIQDYYNAAKIYKDILDKNPGHAKSQVELGILELTQFKNSKGLDRIQLGMDESKVPNDILVRGYTALTNFYISTQPEKALEYAQKAFMLDPRNSSLRSTIISLGGEAALATIKSEDSQLIVLGEGYLRNKNYLAAQAEFKTAFEINPKNAMAALKAGESLWNLNQTKDAIDWSLKALRADPKLMEAYVQLSDYYSQKYDFKAAADFLAKARSENKLNYQLMRAFAQLELRRKSAKTAEKYAGDALKLYDGDVESLNILSESLMMQNQYEKAYQYSAKAISLEANNARAQEVYAESLLGLRGIGAAQQYLAQLVNTYPDNLDYRTSLGLILIKDERYSEAIPVLKQVIDNNPSHMKAQMLLGEAYIRANDLNEALKTYFRAASLDPSGAEPIFQIGQVYLKNPATAAKAMKSFQKVIETNPRYPKAYYYAGQAALQLNLTKQATDYAEMEKKINPKIADPYILLADIYFSQEKYSQSANELRRAVQLRPDDSNLYIQLAKSHRLSGQLDTAASMLRVAASKESGNPDIYREQGAVFEKQGLSDQALSAYLRYLELKPNADDRAEVQSRIMTLGGGN